MVDSRRFRLTVVRALAATLLLIAAATASAAPGFIAGSNITRGTSVAEISIRFACSVQYMGHLPVNEGDRLRIQLESTNACNGVSPTIAQSRQQHRPLDADKASLVEVDYDGDTAGGQILTLVFNESVRYEVIHDAVSNDMTVRVFFADSGKARAGASGASGVRVQSLPDKESAFVINLSSSKQPHAPSDFPELENASGTNIFEAEVILAGTTWYRLRFGPFDSSVAAEAAASKLRDRYPTAWIDRTDKTSDGVGSIEAKPDNQASTAVPINAALASVGLDQVDRLMSDARGALVAGEVSRAVQIYTKVLQVPNHDRHAQAQEYLALAREKNGQRAHATAEYRRYLATYPDGEGADRVSQRLAALLVSDRQSHVADRPLTDVNGARRESESLWRIQSFLSQYYRRDVNQPNEEDEIVSQSALYSDLNLDARRRGERFDFASRISAGYRNDFLGEDEGSGNQLRISYAYADLADEATGLRGRIGRQSRNSAGILGRFDGFNLGYQASERTLLNSVIGKPVNSASDGVDSSRTFYGASVNYGPIFEDLEIGLFFIQQEVDGIEDRQAIGTEFRYLGVNKSLWGLIDYDTSHNELGSAYVQGSWRFASRLTLHGSIDRRHSPFLSTRNALIGQPVASIADLLEIFSEDEIRNLSLDRSPLSTTYTVGLSQTLSPRFQINADANQTTVEATPDSGGVSATTETTYRYVAGSLVASSLLKEGDVTVLGLRYADSETVKVMSLTLDTRFPFGRTWRVNPRFRVDRRENLMDSSYEWQYLPMLRIQYRWSQKLRIEFEAGKRISQRETADSDIDRESYFVNFGYQAYF